MTKDDFHKKVRTQGMLSGINGEAIKRALNSVAGDKNNNYYQADIEIVLKMARALEEMEEERKKENKGLKVINITPQNLITSDDLCDKINPWIESIRREIFNQTTPPFKDIEASKVWIAEKEKEAYADKERKAKEVLLLKKFDEAVTLSRELKIPWNIPDPRSSDFITYHPHLNRIQSEAKRMSNATGFKKYDLILFILTGKKPILQPVKMTWKNIAESLPTGKMLKRFCISFDINTSDLTFNELKAMYDAYRKELRVTKGKPLKEDHLKLYRYVKKLDGPPKKEKTMFWTKVAEKFAYGGWRQAYTAYKRIKKTLQ